ncbi:MAG: single-stranded DNA-binding protein [Bacilli bacterium]
MINRTTLVGRITKDPELRYTGNNTAVCQFTVAVNRTFTNQAGEREADFIPVIAWRKQAENLEKFIKKGMLLGIDGRLQTRTYEAQDGSKRFVTEVVADNVHFLESRKQETAPLPEPTPYYDPNQSQAGQQHSTQTQQPVFVTQETNIDISDDDLPF